MAEQKKSNNRPRGRRFFKPRATGTRGLINFFFSFSGSISKELYVGASTALSALLLIIAFAFWGIAGSIEDLAMASVTQLAGAYSLLTIIMLLVISLIAMGYKRSHALGMSGFYSIVGTNYFQAFFKFAKLDRDNPNDGAFTYKFSKFKWLGELANRNYATQIGYILLMASPSALLLTQGQASQFMFVWAMIAFNIIQVLVTKAGIVRKWYMSAVKVVSFLGYTYIVYQFAWTMAQYTFFKMFTQMATIGEMGIPLQ